MLNRLDRFLAAWSKRVRNSALLVVLACLWATGLSVYYAINHLGINADITSLIDEDVPYLKIRRDYERAFPLLQHILIVVVDADTPQRATEAIDLLGDLFAAEPDIFQGILVPGGGAFFARNALLYLDLDRLENLADRLAEAQPYLAEISKDPTLRGLLNLIERSLKAMRTGVIENLDSLNPTPLFDSVSQMLETSLEGDNESLNWDGYFGFGGASLADQTRRVVLLSPVLDFADLQPAKRAIESVQRIFARTGLDRDPRVTVRLTGDFALSYDEMATVKRQAGAAGMASFLLVALLLTLALRSAWMIGAALVTLITGLACSLAFAAVAVGHLNPISVAFAVLFIGLSVDFSIHLCLRYRELRAKGRLHAEALSGTVRSVGNSLVLCAFTTAIGFYAFVPTDFRGVAELGLIAGTGMGISLFFSITLLPALIELAPERVRANWGRSGGKPPVLPMASLGSRYPQTVRGSALVVGLGALVLIPHAHFDHNPLHVRDPNAESVRALEDLLSESGTSPWSITVAAPDMDTAKALAKRLNALDVVASTITPADFVPGEQDEKLELIREIALFMGPSLTPQDTPQPDVAAEWAALSALHAELERFQNQHRVDPALTASVRRLDVSVEALVQRLEASSTPEAELDTLEASLVEPLLWRLEALHKALRAERVNFEDLPKDLLAHTVGGDGRVRVQVLPREDLNNHVALARFVDTVRSVTPRATGLPVDYLESARTIVRSFQQALLSATLVIALLLFILWWRIVDTVLVMATLGLAGLLTTGVAVLASIPFNFANVIVLPLLLGIGVDSSIHLVHRFRSEVETADELMRSSTARAVFFSALTTIASFGSLGFTPHRGLATMGQLLVIGVVVMLLCNLLVLPALLSRRRARVP